MLVITIMIVKYCGKVMIYVKFTLKVVDLLIIVLLYLYIQIIEYSFE